MNIEFKGSLVQRIGLSVAAGVNAIKAEADSLQGKDTFRHSYQLKMMDEVRHPNTLAVKGWAAIVAMVMASSLVVNSLK